jgi:hypothetical protein
MQSFSVIVEFFMYTTNRSMAKNLDYIDEVRSDHQHLVGKLFQADIIHCTEIRKGQKSMLPKELTFILFAYILNNINYICSII